MTDLVTVSIAVSRAEAVVVASMLEGYGIPVHIGGYAQGTTEYWSHVFGGYRLWISEDDHEAASQIIRQSGALDDISMRKWPRKALVQLILFWAILKGGAILGAFSLQGITPPIQLYGLMAVEVFNLPVNPQGKADYFLKEPS